MGGLPERGHAPFRALVAVVAALAFAPAPLLADTLQVGKVGRAALSFVPVDAGVETGTFKKPDFDAAARAGQGALTTQVFSTRALNQR
jgi:hypothetical protein